MIGQRVIGALRVRFFAVLVAAILGASTFLGGTAAAGLTEDLFFGISTNNYWEVKKLLDQGANVNAKYKGGYTPLMSAIASTPIIVKLLIERGANVNARDDNGRTPLMSACSIKRLDIVKLLIDMGADVNVKSNNGDTALSVARFQRDQHIVRMLESAGKVRVKSTAAVAAKEEVKESDAEPVSERAAKPAPKAKSTPRRPKPAGGSPRPPELPAGGALSGN